MKQLLQIVWLLLFPMILNAQVELRPIYTSPHMGKGAKFSEDGSKIVTWGGFGFSVWDVKTSKVLYTVTGHKNIVNYADFNHKGTAIVTASYDGTAKIWDAKTGDLVQTIKVGIGVFYARFNVTDDRIVGKLTNGGVMLWSAITGDSIVLCGNNDSKLHCVNFSSDGKLLATADNNGILKVYNAVNGSINVELYCGKSMIRGVEIDTDAGKMIVIYSDSISVIPLKRLHDFSIKERAAKDIVNEEVYRCGFNCLHMYWKCYSKHYVYNKMKNTLTLCTPSGSVLVLNTENCKKIKEYKQQYQSYTDVVTDEKGENILAMFEREEVDVINTSTGKLKKFLHTNDWTSGLTNLKKINSDYNTKTDKFLIVHNGITRVWSSKMKSQSVVLYDSLLMVNFVRETLNQKKLECSAVIVNDSVTEIRVKGVSSVICKLNSKVFKPYTTVYFPKTHKLFLRCQGRFVIYDIHTEKYIVNNILISHTDNSDINEDGSKIVISDNPSVIYDGRKGTAFQSVRYTGYCRHSIFSPVGDLLALCDGGRTYVYKCIQSIWERVSTLGNHSGFINSVAFDNSGKYIATTSLDSTAKVWSISSDKAIKVLVGHKSSVSDAQFSSDSKRIVTADIEGVVNVWNTFSGELIAVLKSDKSSIERSYFSDDDQKVITHSGDGVIRIYDANQLPYSFTDIPEEEKQTDISLSPNPAQNEIHICFSEPVKEKGEYIILSPTGVQIAKGDVAIGSNGFTYSIDNNVSSGTYICVLRINGKSREEKFVVMR